MLRSLLHLLVLFSDNDVAFVVDFTYKLFKEVFDCDQSHNFIVFIANDRHIFLVISHIVKQIVNAVGSFNVMCFAQNGSEIKIFV